MRQPIIDCAVTEAMKVDNYRHRMSAVIFHNTTILSKGHNMQYPQNNCRSRHAEVSAFKNFKQITSCKKHCNILILHLKHNNTFGNSKPCKDCLRFLYKSGINKIYYYDDEVKSFRYL